MLKQRLSYCAKNYSVLCIDEDSTILDFLKTHLSEFFAQVITAQDSKNAMELFHKNKVDIILTNIGYGGSNGLVISSDLKEYDPRLKVILVTNHQDSESLIKALKYGVDYYVAKPIDLNELYEGLLKVIRSLDAWYHHEEDVEFTLYDSKPTQDVGSIIDALTTIKNSKHEVKAVNYYKGIAISHRATVLKVENAKLFLIVDYVQYHAAKLENKIIITSEFLEQDIGATVGAKSLSINDKFVLELENLTYLEVSPARRKDIRIVPDENFKTTIISQGVAYDPLVLYVAQDMITIRLEKGSKQFTKDEELGININIKTPQHSLYHSFVQSDLIKCNATVFRIDEFAKFVQIVLLLKFQKSKDAQVMVEYLTKRQKDIINEFGKILKSQN